LDKATNTIRILELLPLEEDYSSSPLRCTLQHILLDENPEYTALSYVWGSPTITKAVYVDGHEVQVTVNLANALYQLRQDGIRYVWADALCINQHDNVEKSDHVRMMKMIYEKADLVIAWLGPEENASSEALEMMEKMATLADGLAIRTPYDPDPRELNAKQLRQLEDRVLKSVDSSIGLDRSALESTSTLLGRSYWTRAWVIQEVCVAKSVMVQCGGTSISCTSLCASLGLRQYWLSCLNKRNRNVLYELTSLLRPTIVDLFCLHKELQKGLGLWQVLALTLNNDKLETTDPKDRIYAFLGLFDVDERRKIDIDLAPPTQPSFDKQQSIYFRAMAATL
jgi:hypothetical protein